MKKVNLLIILCAMLLTSCSAGPFFQASQDRVSAPAEESHLNEPNQPADLELAAQAALMDFYQSLNQGRYKQAVALYGGSFEELEYFNPMIDPEDRMVLMEAGCEINGFMCLSILTADLVQINDQQDFIFEIEFANPDGSLFILGPCCGATEETMPSVSLFSSQVHCDDQGLCRVVNLPPFVP